jgi:hypothetical protein
VERRQPALGLLGEDGPMSRLLAVMAAIATLLLAGCDSSTPPQPTPSTPPPTASAVPRPAASGCHQLTYAEAVAPTLPDTTTDVPCSGSHTAETFRVGALHTTVGGHLVAADSARVQAQVAAACPGALSSYLGGDEAKLRLSMLRAVWFTPTVAQVDGGADWYRCDVIALAGDGTLAPVTGSLKGVLAGPHAGDWAMCGTAQPGTAGFSRVPCRADHTWKALSIVDLPAGAYPGEEKVKAAGQKPCQQAGQNVASDALNYQWGYEWPTADQWASGQTYGICWAPSKG